MDIHTFLDKFLGDWFSQRTMYHLPENKVDNSKANITLTPVSVEDSRVSSLSQSHNLNLDLFLTGILSQWDNSPDWGKPKQKGETLLLFFRDENHLNQGTVVRVINPQQIVKGTYILAEDESLTLRINNDSQSLEERIVFASDNLRLRNTVLKQDNMVRQTCFYSEIRRIVKN